MSSQGGGFLTYAKYSLQGNDQFIYSYKFYRIEYNFRAQIWPVFILNLSTVWQMSKIWLNNKRVWPDYATVTVTDYRPTHTTIRNRKHRYPHNIKNTIKVKQPALSSSAMLTCFEILWAAMQYLNIYFSFYMNLPWTHFGLDKHQKLMSWCHGFVCSLWLWHFLIILTYYFIYILYLPWLWPHLFIKTQKAWLTDVVLES